MATNQSLMNQMNQTPQTTPQAPKKNSVRGLLESDMIQNKFKQVLKDKAAGFTSSLLTLVNNDGYLADSEPMSIITGAMQAAQLDLPLEKQFGFAYLVPFNEKDKATNRWVKKAQFVLGYRGYIQLAQRSGQYKSINVINVFEGQLKGWNPLTEELDYNPNTKESDAVIGYVGYFKLLNGFEKTVYWTKDQVEKHRIDNNKNKDKKALSGVWRTDYDAMAQKTVLRNLLSKWGILSIEMQKAVLSDEKEIEDFDDNGDAIITDVTPEVVEEEQSEPYFDPSEAINNIEVDEATGEIIEQDQLFSTGVKSNLEK